MEIIYIKEFWNQLGSQWKIAFVQAIFKRELNWAYENFTEETLELAKYIPTDKELINLQQIRALRMSGSGGGDFNFDLNDLNGIHQLSLNNNHIEELCLDYNKIRTLEGLNN